MHTFFEKNGNWTCSACHYKLIPRYNPFSTWSGTDTDKNYETDCGNDAMQISTILNNCKAYSIKSLNSKIDTALDTTKNILSSFFLNIDGNSTNFDHLLVILEGISHKFKAIGLAETNTDPNSSKTFSIPNYKSYYQYTREGKKKGTGVALYIHDSLNVTLVSLISSPFFV